MNTDTPVSNVGWIPSLVEYNSTTPVSFDGLDGNTPVAHGGCEPWGGRRSGGRHAEDIFALWPNKKPVSEFWVHHHVFWATTSNFGLSQKNEICFPPHPPGSDFFGHHTPKMDNSTTMCAPFLHPTYVCTSSLHARSIYVLLRTIYFVTHMFASAALSFKFFAQPQKLQISTF